MNFLNANFVHNVINVLIVGLTYALIGSGCVQDDGGTLNCSQSWINQEFTAYTIAFLGLLKIIMNVVRDGVFGLWKVQPPVVNKPLVK